jgi:uncharacterized protein YbjT (DUF2867 family)
VKVLVAGATGAVGRPLVRALVDAGHSITGLARHPAGNDLLARLGADAVTADAMDRDGLLRALDGRTADASSTRRPR